MKKSLLVTFDFPPVTGGISHSLWNFCFSLPEKSIIVLTQPASVVIKTPFSIIRRRLLVNKYIWPRWILLLWHMYTIVRQEKIEIIQAGQILPVGTAALILKKLLNIPYVVYVYGQDLFISQKNQRKFRLIKSILSHADGIIANSIFTKNCAIDLGAPKNSTVVAYPYFPRFRGQQVHQSQLESFKRVNKLEQNQVLLTVGNLVNRKGHTQVLRALPTILKEYPKVKYIVVGKGDTLEDLQRLTRELGLGNNVLFAGKVSDIELPLYYYASDIFIMPSRALRDINGQIYDVEGFGMVYLEAASFGKPVIGGNTGGMPEAIVDGKTGIIVDSESISEIVAALRTLLSDPKRAQAMGAAGKQYVEYEYNTQQQLNGIKHLLS